MSLATSIDLWVLECLRSISTFMVCLCVLYAVQSDFSSGGRRWSVKYNRSGLWINPDHLLFGVMEICMGPSTAMMVIAVLGALLCSVSVPGVSAQNPAGFWKYQFSVTDLCILFVVCVRLWVNRLLLGCRIAKLKILLICMILPEELIWTNIW